MTGVRLLGPVELPVLAAPLAVGPCAVEAVVDALGAAAELAEARTGRRPDVEVDTRHIAAAVRSELLLRDVAGHGIAGFAPLSRIWRAADGWVRTHANYPWHRAALLTAFGLPPELDDEAAADRLESAFGGLPADQIEDRAYAAGGLAVASRSSEQWRAVGVPDVPRQVTTARSGAAELPPPPEGGLPAAGVRVLDLTRVIAGPVGTRMLGALGADVLRIDARGRPELPLHAVDGTVGKRSAPLDASTASGRRQLHALLDGADVLVTGYRPGAMGKLGLEPDQVAQAHPHVSVVTLSAWGRGDDGEPSWGARRGFDSLVQIASGIGALCSTDGDRPGTLPCQLLDHATGYLVAAAALRACTERVRAGTTSVTELSLVRTARWLLDHGVAEGAVQQPQDDEAWLGDWGNGWTGVRPPGRIDGRELRWPHPPAYGQARAEWPFDGLRAR